MSVESLAEGIWERQCDPSAFSAMAPGGFLRGVVAGGIGRVRRDGGHCLGLAKRGRGHGESSLGHRVRGGQPHGSGEKKGRKRSLLVDGRGVPLSLVASGANVHDVKLLAATLDQVIRARPAPRAKAPQHLCADAGYKGATARQAVEKRHYRPNIKQRREEADAKRKRPGYKARRWVVERTHSWLNRFRKLLVSFEKTKEGYVALLALAAAMICWRQTIIIYG